jgi:threonine/homoserine/homoserine lactone efflux protein
MDTHLMWGFVAAALLAYVIPGPDWFVVLRHASRSRVSGVSAALGVQSGLIVHMTVAALGLSAILLTSAEVFTVVKLLGAAYLAFLGVQALRDAYRGWRSSEPSAPTLSDDSVSSGPRKVWAQAFAANVLNPKAALFFVAVLPQFVDPTSSVTLQIMTLGAIDIAIGVAWWFLFVFATVRLKSVLHRRRARIGLDTAAGVALCSLGGVLAATGRPQPA